MDNDELEAICDELAHKIITAVIDFADDVDDHELAIMPTYRDRVLRAKLVASSLLLQELKDGKKWQE